MTAFPEVMETPENREGGVLVVLMPGAGSGGTPSRRSFFSDRAAGLGSVIEDFASWFELWGIPLARARGSETSFERSFSIKTWPDRPVEGHGPQMIPRIAQKAGELSAVLEERKPRLIIFLSCYLWRAACLPQAGEVLNAAAGRPLDNGRRITAGRLGAFIQRREKCVMLALPQPSKNTTPEIVSSFAAGVQEAFAISGIAPGRHMDDPLLLRAARFLVLDREMSVRSIRSNLRISASRAEEIFDGLEGVVYVKDPSGRAMLKKQPR